MSPLRRVALFAIPIVAFVTLAIGLRIGARSAVRAAIVYGAPPAAAASGLAWQVQTIDEDNAVRTPAAVAALSVDAHANGRHARWSGASNEDGVAEAWLDLPGIKRGDRVDLVVRDARSAHVLAEGTAAWGDATTPSGVAWTRYARRDGVVALDVAVYGQRLAPGFPSAIWVRATDRATGAPIADASIEAEPEGMTLAQTTVKTDARGWAALAAEPIGHVLQLILRARASDRTGEWAGALAAAPGGCGVSLPARVLPNAAHTFEVVAPTRREHAYIEVDDASGRAAGAVATLKVDATSTPRATFDLPKLAPGLYWLSVSGAPNGAADGSSATTVHPFFVAATDDEALKTGLSPEGCASTDPREAKRATGPCLALAWAGPFPRWTALEGFGAVRARDAANRARGMAIAVGSVVIAAALETLLIALAVAESRRRLRASHEAAGEDASKLTARFTALRIAIGLLVALLGFGLVLALVLRAA